MSSNWVKFRNAVEAVLKPEISAAVQFGEALVHDVEAAASGNITVAFDSAVAAFASAPGDLEAKVLAAVTSFATTLLGYEVAIIKKDLGA